MFSWKMTTTCFIGVIVGVDGDVDVVEAAVTDTAFTDASILLEVSENITAIDMASITNLFIMII
jgi:hypothetical protein